MTKVYYEKKKKTKHTMNKGAGDTLQPCPHTWNSGSRESGRFALHNLMSRGLGSASGNLSLFSLKIFFLDLFIQWAPAACSKTWDGSF